MPKFKVKFNKSEVQAIQFKVESAQQVFEFIFNGKVPESQPNSILLHKTPEGIIMGEPDEDTYAFIYLHTMQGQFEVLENDWIVKKESGLLVVVKPTDFKREYEEIPEPQN